jgi:hypothetical protein
MSSSLLQAGDFCGLGLVLVLVLGLVLELGFLSRIHAVELNLLVGSRWF